MVSYKQQLIEANKQIEIMKKIISNYQKTNIAINHEVIESIQNAKNLDENEKHINTYDCLMESLTVRNEKISKDMDMIEELLDIDNYNHNDVYLEEIYKLYNQ